MGLLRSKEHDKKYWAREIKRIELDDIVNRMEETKRLIRSLYKELDDLDNEYIKRRDEK